MKHKVNLLDKINLPKKLALHIFGQNHTHGHKITIGVLIMWAGVYLVRFISDVPLPLMHMLADVIGYGIHGVGLSPYIDYLQEKARMRNSKNKGEVCTENCN